MRREKMSIGELTVGSCSLHDELLGLFGQKYYVGGPNGSNGNSGLSKTSAFGTIQAAITAQIAYSTGYGDVIYVAPGTYAETLTGDLSEVELIGCGRTPYGVVVAPTDSYAFTGGMSHAALFNMTFLTPDTSSKDLAAVLVAADMEYSVSDNCWFMGTDPTCTAGLQICPQVTNTSWEQMLFSIISRCKFVPGASATHTFRIGINLFADSTQANQAKKLSKNSRIFGNIIYAEDAGIKINTQKTNNRGTVIDHNIIRANETTSGPRWGIICRSTNGDDQTMMVCYNTITANDVPIEGFLKQSTFGNICAVGTGTPAGEYGYAS